MHQGIKILLNHFCTCTVAGSRKKTQNAGLTDTRINLKPVLALSEMAKSKTEAQHNGRKAPAFLFSTQWQESHCVVAGKLTRVCICRGLISFFVFRHLNMVFCSLVLEPLSYCTVFWILNMSLINGSPSRSLDFDKYT